MANAPKTSTFEIDHETCNPALRTPEDVLTLNRFVKFGDLRDAAALARKGMRLILSEHHVPLGGDMEHIGWAEPALQADVYVGLDEAVDGAGSDCVTQLCRIYRGPIQYVARFAVGSDGEYEGDEYEVFDTAERAKGFLEGLKALDDAAPDDAGDLADIPVA